MLQSGTLQREPTRRDPRGPAEVGILLDGLVSRGALDPLAAARARDVQRDTGQRIDEVVMQLGLLSDHALADALAAVFGITRCTADMFPPTPILAGVLDPAFLRRCRLVPLGAEGDRIVLATTDPYASDTHAAVGFLLDRGVEIRLATASDLARALDALYGPGSAPLAAHEVLIETGGEPSARRTDDVQRLRDLASEAPVVQLVQRLIAAAIDARASDIHIEPFADAVRVRYRIDGVMAEVERIPLDLQAGIASRIKVLARLDVAERRIPQDGRTRIVHRGRDIDLRIATAPLLDGESLVLRILDRAAVTLDFAALGFAAAEIATLDRLLLQPNGIVLVTGPTGSGKTTTLYAALSRLNAVERKIFTVEDPIEYQLGGISQIQVKPQIDFDFAAGLRAILRQDPDVVMVGEIRDAETARTGVQAALTGHLVLSTLHTNSAAASITRLLDMGIEDFLLASSVTGILAQRLVRRLCECAIPDADGIAAIRAFDTTHALGATVISPRRPCGCPACGGSGYRGRTTLAEILVVDAPVRARIKSGVTDRAIEEVAAASGFTTLLQNGLVKAASGETTLAEVLRVARS